DWLFAPEPEYETSPEPSPSPTETAVAVLEAPEDEEPAGPAWWEPDGPRIIETPKLKRPAETHSETAAFAALEKMLAASEMELPQLPRVPQQVLMLLRQENVSLDKVGEVISQDPVQAAAILRRANSAALGGRTKATGMNAALTRLGTRGL